MVYNLFVDTIEESSCKEVNTHKIKLPLYYNYCVLNTHGNQYTVIVAVFLNSLIVFASFFRDRFLRNCTIKVKLHSKYMLNNIEKLHTNLNSDTSQMHICKYATCIFVCRTVDSAQPSVHCIVLEVCMCTNLQETDKENCKE